MACALADVCRTQGCRPSTPRRAGRLLGVITLLRRAGSGARHHPLFLSRRTDRQLWRACRSRLGRGHAAGHDGPARTHRVPLADQPRLHPAPGRRDRDARAPVRPQPGWMPSPNWASATSSPHLFRPLPSFVVAGYLGVPEADRAQFESWTRGIVEANAAAGPTQAADTAAALFGYFTTLIERRRTEPADDTISDLVRLMDGDVAGHAADPGFRLYHDRRRKRHRDRPARRRRRTAHQPSGPAAAAAEPARSAAHGHRGTAPADLARASAWPAPSPATPPPTGARSPVGARSCCCTGRPTGTPGCSVPARMSSTSCAARRADRVTWPSPSARTTAWAPLPRRLQARIVLQELLARFPRFAVNSAGRHVRSR